MALTTNLEAFWTCNNTTVDSESSIDLTESGDPTYGTGVIGNCFDLDGTGDYYTTDSDPYDINSSDVSISFWIKPDDSTPASEQAIISNKYLINGASNKLAITLGTGGNISVNSKDTGAVNFSSTGTINSSGWTHIVLTRTGSTYKIYMDGSLDTSTTGASGDISTNANWAIGDSDAIYEFAGLIDLIGIWSKVLDSDEVSSLYNSGDGLTYPFSDSGYSNTVNGVTTPGKINGIAVANISKFNGV